MLTSRASRIMAFLPVMLATLAFSCETTAPSDSAVAFRFQIREAPGAAGQFVARTNDAEVIRVAREQLALPAAERQLFINGLLARGNGGHNTPWSWHFVLSDWELVATAAEVCDGTPDMVEDDLDYWVDHLGYYCPWSAYVVEER